MRHFQQCLIIENIDKLQKPATSLLMASVTGDRKSASTMMIKFMPPMREGRTLKKSVGIATHKLHSIPEHPLSTIFIGGSLEMELLLLMPQMMIYLIRRFVIIAMYEVFYIYLKQICNK